MKKILCSLLACCWVLVLYSSLGPSWAEEKSSPSNDHKVAKETSSETVKGKAQKEIKEVKKGAKEAGREMKASAEGVSNKAEKEFRKAGKEVKEVGKALKESFQEAWKDFKNLFKE